MATKPKKAGNGGLQPPKGGAIVRMYRIGHGDCFLIAFDGDKQPVHVLIDCGYKPGSPGFIKAKKTDPDDIVADIKAVTGGHIDVAIVTHEHQDHVNAITKKRFDGFTIGETWFAWTESEDDKLAKLLRRKHKDHLKTLAAASNRLAASADRRDRDVAERVNALIALEIGGEDEKPDIANLHGLAAAGGATPIKDAMKIWRDLAKKGVKCLYPHREIVEMPGAKSVRVYALGPPYDEKQIRDLDPHGSEGFKKASSLTGLSVAAALGGETASLPFSVRYATTLDALRDEGDLAKWFKEHCGAGDAPGDSHDPPNGTPIRPNAPPVANNAPFRRIDGDWLQSAEQLALAMGEYTNNSSLVLAFELGKGGKVLLFAGDAQRGNWASWASDKFKDDEDGVEVRELLGRVVLYKVGHHGSHNATLNGMVQDAWPNLAWFGRGKHADEFTAMITAVRAWAMQPSVKWDHPLKSIKDALIEKAAGRVFQTDTDFDKMKLPKEAGETAWKAFQKRASGGPLYFDLVIEP